MRVVIQRVSEASVVVDHETVAATDQGLVILLGKENADTTEDIYWLVNKIKNLRIFNDDKGVMNHSVTDIQGEILVVSQFTLFASTRKGNRPSYIRSAKPDIAVPLYQRFIEILQEAFSKEIKTGIFGADMKVTLINDGPVTIIIDSKNRE